MNLDSKTAQKAVEFSSAFAILAIASNFFLQVWEPSNTNIIEALTYFNTFSIIAVVVIWGVVKAIRLTFENLRHRNSE